MDRQADVVVIGGGIAGSAITYQLAKRKTKVMLFEKGSIGDEQSGRAWGFVRQQGRSPREIPIMMESVKMWRSLSKELNSDVEWIQGGNLAAAYDKKRLQKLEEWCAVGKEYGLDVKMLSGPQVHNMIPRATGSFIGGMYTKSDGHAEPLKTTLAFARAAQENGANITTQCAVIGIETTNGQVTGVITEKGLVRCSVVVCAAGAWSHKVARMASISLPYRVVRSTVAETTPTEAITPLCFWTPGLSFRQRPNGSFYVASSARSDYDIDLEFFRDIRLFLPNFIKNRRLFRIRLGKELFRDLLRTLPWPSTIHQTLDEEPIPNYDSIAATMKRFHELFPFLDSVRIQRVWAGKIDATPDAVPVMGEVKKPKGFIFATGFSGHGFAMGPVVGRVISELILDGKPSVDLYPMRHSRFKDGDMDDPKALF